MWCVSCVCCGVLLVHCSLIYGSRDGHVNYVKEWTGDAKYDVTDESASGTPSYKPCAKDTARKAVVVTSAQDRKFLAAVADTMVCSWSLVPTTTSSMSDVPPRPCVCPT